MREEMLLINGRHMPPEKCGDCVHLKAHQCSRVYYKVNCTALQEG